MRLSDILKRSTEVKKAPETPDARPSDEIKQAPIEEHRSAPSVAEISRPRQQVQTPAVCAVPAEEAYSKAVTEIKNLFLSFDKNLLFSEPINSHLDIIDLLAAGSDEILMLADRATPDTYIYAHSVNVMIFAVLIGQNSGLSKQKVTLLALCAYLHDLGMGKYMHLAARPEILSHSEIDQIRKHPEAGSELIRKISSIPRNDQDIIADAILQVHERKNGSGYPKGLKENDISDIAKIISIADTYEAMTHPRPYRDRVIPHEALKSMIYSADDLFDTEYMKHFIDQLSLYPPGSYVKLNTEEIARVVSINKGMCTRPKIRMIIDRQLQRITEPRTLNLSTEQMVYIKEALNETTLELSDKRLAIELKAIRWWVKGI